MEIFEITLLPSSSITNSAIYTRNLNGFAHITFLRHAAYQSRTQQRLIILKRHYQLEQTISTLTFLQLNRFLILGWLNVLQLTLAFKRQTYTFHSWRLFYLRMKALKFCKKGAQKRIPCVDHFFIRKKMLLIPKSGLISLKALC